ncbi:MAG TPA: hypothetical protein VFZ58_04965 [Candidatus Saccharimonadales bacterium]
MVIEVLKQGLFGKSHVVRCGLTTFPYGGKPYATWRKPSPFLSVDQRLPISSELAWEAGGKEGGIIYQADWDQAAKMLVPASEAGQLIVWLKGRNWQERSEKAFPRSEQVHEELNFVLLRVCPLAK